jgi:UDP-3-O-[3-hydroxymyristoyl] N-acetylglucosamine deacetylase
MVIRGQGLHSGARGAVSFARSAGPVVLRANGAEVAISALAIVATARATTVASADGAIRIATLEHVLAALAGLGVHDGIAIVLEGPEAPLADGGARAFADAIRALGVPCSPPPLRVVAQGSVAVGASRYDFEPHDGTAIEVEVEFDEARTCSGLARTARWDGDPEDFLARIAPARTFGFEHEVAELLARGLASHVTPESVVVLGPERVLSAGAPFRADEPARHKLLDLLGDLYLYGGPPRGRVRAVRPGHAATHEALRTALARGLVLR